VADSRGRAYRQTHANGVDHVWKWVAKWWGDDLSDLAITEFTIECPSPDELLTCAGDAVYVDAFRKRNESDLHKLLKYSAWLWLEKQKPIGNDGGDSMQFEQIVYFPTEVADNISIGYPDGTPIEQRFDITRAQIVPRGYQYGFYSYGIQRTIDVFGRGRNIEVGNTRPAALCEPFDYGLSEAAIWVPFPDRLKPKEFSLSDYSFRSVPAFEFRLVSNHK